VISKIQRDEVFAGMRLAFFMFAGYCFQTAGLQYTTASNSGFVTGSSVVLVPLLLGVFWGRTLTKWIYAGATGALVGLYFLTVPAEGMRYLNRGDVLTLVAAGFYALHIILVGQALARTLRIIAESDSGGGLRGAGLAADGIRGGNALAGGAIRLGRGFAVVDLDLRRVRDRGGLYGATMGPAVHYSWSRGHFVRVRASLCRDDFVSVVA
jgi:hypothetical protein